MITVPIEESVGEWSNRALISDPSEKFRNSPLLAVRTAGQACFRKSYGSLAELNERIRGGLPRFLVRVIAGHLEEHLDRRGMPQFAEEPRTGAPHRWLRSFV